MTRITLHRVALALGASALALTMAACDQRPTSAAGPAPTLRIAFRAAVTGGPTEALAKVDGAHVTVTRSGTTLMDTTLAYTPAGLSLDVRLPDPSGTVVVSVELTSHGVVLFRGGGSADVQRGSETRVPITVTPVVAGLTGPDSVVLTAIGDTVRLRGAAVFASADTIFDAPLSWLGDGGGVIAVSSDGKVTALREGVGQAKLSCLSLSRTTRVRVQSTAAQLTLSTSSISLLVDSTATISAVARDRNGNLISRAVSWRSASPGVATVDANGVVKGVAAGATTVTATLDAVTATATVTVKQVPVAAVKVAPTSATLQVGGTVALSATTLDAKGAVLTGRTVTWSSSNPGVATVDATGLVRAVAAGSASVTATSEGQSASASIVIVQPTVAATPASLSFALVSGGPAQVGAISVTNAGGGTLSGLTVSVAWGSGTSGWLSASLSSTTAPATLTLTASPGALPAGTYTATVTISSDIPGSGSAQVAVDMNVSKSPGVIGVEQGTDLFIPMRTDTLGAPTGITVDVINLGSGTLSGLSRTVNQGTGQPGWLSATLGSGTAPTTLNIRAQGYVSPAFGGAWVGDIVLSSSMPGVAPLHVHVTYQ